MGGDAEGAAADSEDGDAGVVGGGFVFEVVGEFGEEMGFAGAGDSFD